MYLNSLYLLHLRFSILVISFSNSLISFSNSPKLEYSELIHLKNYVSSTYYRNKSFIGKKKKKIDSKVWAYLGENKQTNEAYRKIFERKFDWIRLDFTNRYIMKTWSSDQSIIHFSTIFRMRCRNFKILQILFVTHFFRKKKVQFCVVFKCFPVIGKNERIRSFLVMKYFCCSIVMLGEWNSSSYCEANNLENVKFQVLMEKTIFWNWVVAVIRTM